MCVAAIVLRPNDKFKLVAAFNRDEFFDRETLSLHYWGQEKIFGGRDLKRGGTWLGFGKDGKFAFLTNHRNPKLYRNGLASRGRLVTNYLMNEETPAQFITNLSVSTEECNGYNLVVGELNTPQALYYSNRGPGIYEFNHHEIYGLSNAFLNTPWPKVSLVRKVMQGALERENPLPYLLQGFANSQRYADELLPSTGVPLEMERALSPAFISIPSSNYGTRCTTIVFVNYDNSVQVHETTYDITGTVLFETTLSYSIISK